MQREVFSQDLLQGGDSPFCDYQLPYRKGAACAKTRKGNSDSASAGRGS
jgi:hypothetical protein